MYCLFIGVKKVFSEINIKVNRASVLQEGASDLAHT